MKVLAVCYEDPEYILGGMGMHVRELYRAMAQQGVEIDLLTDSSRDGSEPYLGFTKHYADKLVAWKPKRPDLACLFQLDIQMARKLARMIASGQSWDLVHCHEWNSLQLARMARDALQVPMVTTMHLCLTYLGQVEHPECTSKAALRDADLYMMTQEGRLVCEGDEFIVASRAYSQIIKSQFLTDRPINVIPNGINAAEWHPAAGDRSRAITLHGLSERPVALFVGRIATMKGIVPLLDAVAQADSGYTVVLAGEVNADSKEDIANWHVTQRIQELQGRYPERLKWVGFRHGQELRDLYAAADVVIMPSIHEPFGIVALEAMAMGTPLIATEVDGLGEIVNGDEGQEYALIIPPRSKEAILGALALCQSPGVLEELRKLGLERSSHYSWTSVARQTISVYHRALEGHHACITERPCSASAAAKGEDPADQHRDQP